jgi:NADPH:quinone reductase
MSTQIPKESLQLRSLVKESGEVELSLVGAPTTDPGPDEVVVRIEAAPINPSDLGLLLAAADWKNSRVGGTSERPTCTLGAVLSPGALRSLGARIGISMPVGNEGAGTVVAAGSSPGAQALLGRTVAVLGGAMYAQFRTLSVNQCLLLPRGTTAREGASCFVNPLTSLGMVDTMKREGHQALVHTAAASNLGQMLNRVCLKDKIPLLNIVRKADQGKILREAGAVHVCRSDSPTFMHDLTEALAATGATIAFDAIGGGPLAGQILSCMEAALNRSSATYSRYGSATHKQVYLYGALDTSATTLTRDVGMAWGVGGWLLTPYLQRIGPQALQALKDRVAGEIKTTFASHYSGELSLAEALHPDNIEAYGKRATGQKFLINPGKGL